MIEWMFDDGLTGRQEVKVVKARNEANWFEWMRRITAGDEDAEAELVSRYKDGIAIIIGRIVQNQSVTEDLSQDTFKLVLEKIRDGEVREPERLSGFICGVARNLAIEYIRKTRRTMAQEDLGMAEQLSDSQPDPFDRLLQKEQAEIVRQTLDELKVERDRQMLIRYYIHEEEKDRICADLQMTGLQFNSVIFRALKRFKELYLKHQGKF